MTTTCKYIDDYITAIRTGAVKANEDIMLAIDLAERKLSDPDVFIDTDKIDTAVELIERYFIMRLLPWELYVLALVHCYYKSSDSVVFDEFFIMMGRGNGKNGFISALAWYLTTHYHGIDEYNVDIIANSEDQARTSFDDVYNMLDRTWTKSKGFFYKSKELIRNTKTGSYIKFNTSNARTKDGKRSACLIFDEEHEYENAKMIGVFSSGFGKRKHSRIFKITTQGYVREGVLDDDLRLAADVLNGVVTNIGLYPLLYRMESDEECDNPELWEKANPSLPYFPELRKEIEKACVRKRYDKQTELDYYTKRMNRPRAAEELPVTEWDNIVATNTPLPDLTGWSCVVGIDYSMLRDWAAVNVHFWRDDKRYDFGRYFVCTQNPDINRIKPDWRSWDSCVPVDEPQISPYLIAEYVASIGRKHDIKKVSVDNFRYALLSKALGDIGISKERDNLYCTRPSDIMKTQPIIDNCFVSRNFVWGDNPALRWAANNTKLVSAGRKEGTDTGNYYYAKIEPKARKNDPFMALVHAMAVESELYTISATSYDDLPVIMG